MHFDDDDDGPRVDTAAARYALRIERWCSRSRGPTRLVRRLRFHFWWLLHNLVAHPLLAVAPTRRLVDFHDWTSRKLWPADDAPSSTASPVPRIHHRLRWVLHNLGAHVAIGLLPCALTFRWHDDTAGRMDVPDWV